MGVIFINAKIEDAILKETQALFTARTNYKVARDNYLSELERDCERSEGSMAQEARRESHQRELREADRSAKAVLDAQEKKVDDLKKQYLSLD